MRFRRRHSTKKNLKISIIIIALVLIGVGYAYINSTLGISGATTITSNSWDVHFANVRMENNSFDSTNDSVTIDENDPTSLDLDLSLETIDDYILVYVDIVNDGGIDAVLKSISNNILTEEQYEYLDFKIYIADDNNYNPIDTRFNDFKENAYYLKAGNIDTLIIQFNYSRYADLTDVENETNINNDLTLTFGQASRKDSNEKNKPTLYSLAFKNAQNDSTLNFSQPSSSTNGNGLFVVNGTENDYNPIYYYRGEVDNNYVAIYHASTTGSRLACYRILRSTNTGSIKLLYAGVSNSSIDSPDCSETGYSNDDVGDFNDFDNDNAAAGLKYGAKGASTYEATHENINNSDIYNSPDYIHELQVDESEYWCNDRSGLSYGTNEATSDAYNRIVNNTGLSLYCSQPNDSLRGYHGVLYMTADEAIYAGAGYTNNNNSESNSFIKNGKNYWTITPSRFTGGKMKIFYVSLRGMLKETNAADELNYVYVLALKRGVRVKSGNGTATNPYTLIINVGEM